MNDDTMKHAIFTLSILSMTSCTDVPAAFDLRVHDACPPGCVCVCEDHSSSSGSSSSSDGASVPDLPAPTGPQTPAPTGTCPAFTPGLNTFCPAGMPCRDVEVRGPGTGGPLHIFWHGTFNSPDSVLSDPWHPASLISDQWTAAGGLAIYPWADQDAVSRPGQPFPWWVVSDCALSGAQCDRQDDFLLADEIVGCAVEAGLVDPYRITTAGMSAGGIMTSTLTGERSWLAGVVSWSGGMGDGAPMTPAGPADAMVIHGGASDLYCGTGAGAAPGDCYSFLAPSEAFAADVAAVNWAFLCDHSEGDTTFNHHAPAMAGEGALFLSQAVWGQAHPTEQDPFPGGLGWMVDNYCYGVGQPSPW